MIKLIIIYYKKKWKISGYIYEVIKESKKTWIDVFLFKFIKLFTFLSNIMIGLLKKPSFF